jgi:hypothetical protein
MGQLLLDSLLIFGFLAIVLRLQGFVTPFPLVAEQVVKFWRNYPNSQVSVLFANRRTPPTRPFWTDCDALLYAGMGIEVCAQSRQFQVYAR